jgi:hypothetical protein
MKHSGANEIAIEALQKEEAHSKTITETQETNDEASRIVAKIRTQYSLNKELSIFRKKIAGEDKGEFDKYNEFAKKCTADVKAEEAEENLHK